MEELFEAALGLVGPWYIEKVEFTDVEGEQILDIFIDFMSGYKYEYNGEYYGAYDHHKRTWRHLNFFQHECRLHASVPRVQTPDGIMLIDVPWASAGSSFTLLFEAYVILLAKSGLSMSAIGRLLNESDKRMMRIVDRIVTHALTTQDIEVVKHLGVDETSSKKGHNYLTIMHDLTEKKVVGIGEGKDIAAFEAALCEMEIRGADRGKVKSVIIDMSPAFISATSTYISQADIVFDRFHLIQPLNKAVDEVRKEEGKTAKELKKTKYLWLRNGSDLSDNNTILIDELADTFPQLGQAYRLKEQFKICLDLAVNTQRLKPINDWIKLAKASKIEPILKVVNTYLNHWYGIRKYIKYKLTNGYVESINLGIQNIKRIARGFTNLKNFKIMIYLKYAKLDLTPTHYK